MQCDYSNDINYPLGTGNHTTYKHGDDWGMATITLFYRDYTISRHTILFTGYSGMNYNHLTLLTYPGNMADKGNHPQIAELFG